MSMEFQFERNLSKQKNSLFTNGQIPCWINNWLWSYIICETSEVHQDRYDWVSRWEQGKYVVLKQYFALLSQLSSEDRRHLSEEVQVDLFLEIDIDSLFFVSSQYHSFCRNVYTTRLPSPCDGVCQCSIPSLCCLPVKCWWLVFQLLEREGGAHSGEYFDFVDSNDCRRSGVSSLWVLLLPFFPLDTLFIVIWSQKTFSSHQLPMNLSAIKSGVPSTPHHVFDISNCV